jgi:pheromone shutdown protein TraB
VLAGLGIVVSVVFLGGFTMVMNGLDEAGFAEWGVADLLGLKEAPAGEAYQLASTLAAWFGFTLLAVLLLAAAGLMATRGRPWRRRTGWWFVAAGLVCLLGSQLIAYPVAFIFFLTAGLFALRPVEPRSAS